MTKYKEFSRFIVCAGAIFGAVIAIPMALASGPTDLFTIILGTGIGTFIGVNIGLAILRIDFIEHRLLRSKLFRMYQAASDVE